MSEIGCILTLIYSILILPIMFLYRAMESQPVEGLGIWTEQKYPPFNIEGQNFKERKGKKRQQTIMYFLYLIQNKNVVWVFQFQMWIRYIVKKIKDKGRKGIKFEKDSYSAGLIY